MRGLVETSEHNVPRGQRMGHQCHVGLCCVLARPRECPSGATRPHPISSSSPWPRGLMHNTFYTHERWYTSYIAAWRSSHPRSAQLPSLPLIILCAKSDAVPRLLGASARSLDDLPPTSTFGRRQTTTHRKVSLRSHTKALKPRNKAHIRLNLAGRNVTQASGYSRDLAPARYSPRPTPVTIICLDAQ